MRAMKHMTVVLLLCGIALGKDVLQVEVKATHSVIHEDQSTRAVLQKGLNGSTAPTKDVEVYNLDAVINGEHVVLACDDPKGCESPALGTYDGELKKGKWIKLTFSLPVTHKEVSRWYKMAGSW